MPIGAPFQSPEPKSACTVAAAPIALTYVAEFGSSGSVSTGVFQTLSAGRIWQPPTLGGAAACSAAPCAAASSRPRATITAIGRRDTVHLWAAQVAAARTSVSIVSRLSPHLSSGTGTILH